MKYHILFHDLRVELIFFPVFKPITYFALVFILRNEYCVRAEYKFCI